MWRKVFFSFDIERGASKSLREEKRLSTFFFSIWIGLASTCNVLSTYITDDVYAWYKTLSVAASAALKIKTDSLWNCSLLIGQLIRSSYGGLTDHGIIQLGILLDQTLQSIIKLLNQTALFPFDGCRFLIVCQQLHTQNQSTDHVLTHSVWLWHLRLWITLFRV